MRKDIGKGACAAAGFGCAPRGPSLLAVAALAALVPCVFVPLQTWLGNKTAFGFGFAALAGELAVLWLVGAIVLWLFLFVGQRWLGRLPVALVLAGMLYAYLETGILMVGAPPLDGELVFWSNPVRAAVDTTVLLVIVAAAIAFRGFLAKYALPFAGAVALLSAASLCDVQGEVIETRDSLNDNSFASGIVARDVVAKSAFFSTNRNVIVFILDATTDEVLCDVLKNEPDIARPFDGFRVFRDNVGMYPSTPYGVAGLMTGRRYDGTLSLGEYIESPFSEASVLYSYLTADIPMFVQLGSFKRFGFTNRARRPREGAGEVRTPCIFRWIDGEQEWSIAQLAFFRLMPFAAKRRTLAFLMWRWVWRKGRISLATDSDSTLFNILSKAAVRSSEPMTFHVYHTQGCHAPFTIDRNGQSVPPVINYAGSYEKMCFVLKNLGSLLDRIREGGAYDPSMIVITADHGNYAPGRAKFWGVNVRKNTFFNRAFPCLAVKTANAHGPLREVQIPTSHENVARILAASREGNLDENAVDNILRADGERVFTDNYTHRPGDVWLDWVFHTDGTVSQRTYNPRQDPKVLPPIALGKTLSFNPMSRGFGNVLPPIVCAGLMDGRVQPSFKKEGSATLSMKVSDQKAMYDVTLDIVLFNSKESNDTLAYGDGQILSLLTHGKPRTVFLGKPASKATIVVPKLFPDANGVLNVSVAKSGSSAEVFFHYIRVDKRREP